MDRQRRFWRPLGPISMPAERPAPALVPAPPLTWRVEYLSPSLLFSRINAVDARLESGNRFDIAGAGVLYAATEPVGAFAETLASFRPSSSLLAKLATFPAEPGRLAPGVVEPAWRLNRRLRSLRVRDALPFIDIDDPRTHTYLTRAAAAQLNEMNVGNLDVAQVRGPSRLLTRAVATWIYSQIDEHGQPLYSGIRYGSRLGDYECWAIFDGTTIEVVDEFTIERSTPELRQIESAFGLTIR